ncbi:hypothetical protein DID78_00120 [Candidatus Marinamargulisbacteria bacterium SCGC AG-343-D04]|nr:hypothetical protein DID78_00120 [Candidatus Marinamargulisbacteria bacterium SCGC AG-343-D04]
MRLLSILFCILLSIPLFGAVIFQPQPDNLFIVDDFEDADLKKMPEWWGFDDIELSVEPNNLSEFKYLGNRSMSLKGDPKDWYVGGCGTYFGVDVTNYNAIKLVIRGYGSKSGVLIVELFDDDNDNFELEPHPNVSSETLADDKFIHTVKVDWLGWKVVIIPFDRFVDGNLGIGDDIWNPYQEGSSGGLLQMQFVLLAADKTVMPRMLIDVVKLYYQGPIPIKKDERSQYVEDADFF